MVKIRLKRMGAHKKPFYRIVVADSRNARNGKFIEEIGYYDPLKEPPVIKVDNERAEYWLGEGAQATDVVRGLLKKSGVTVKSRVEHFKPFEKKEKPVPEEPQEVKEETKAEEIVEEPATEEPAAEAPAEETPEEAPAEEAAPEEPAAEETPAE